MDANTLAAIAAALDERERAEAAMTAGPWTSTPDGERGFREFHSAEDNHTRSWAGEYKTSSLLCHYEESLPEGPFNGCAVFVHNADADGCALLRNAAPAYNAMHRKLFELAKGWLLPAEDQHIYDLHPTGRNEADGGILALHDAAEQIIALLAQALLPQGVTK